MFSKDIKLKKVQETSLNLAEYFVNFCKKNNLLCYLCGGGAIGAIRHKGFIPWDDDLDFFMPRDDYKKLLRLWKQQESEGKYVLLRSGEEYNDRNSFTTLRDSETTFIKTYQTDLDIVHGIQIDIFPLDKAPESSIRRKKQKFWAMVYALYCSQQIPKNHGSLFSLMGRLLLDAAQTNSKKYRLWRYAEKKMTRYENEETNLITELCVGPRYMGNVYKKDDFSRAIFVEFEYTKLPIPIGYDNYLTQVFGNYMERPPKEQQVSHHEAVFIDPDNSYKKYEGIYYLTSKEEKK